MRENSTQLFVARFLQQTGRNVILASTGVGGVNLRLVDNSDVDLLGVFWMVHGCKQRRHDPVYALGLSRRYLTNVRRLRGSRLTRHRAAVHLYRYDARGN